MLIMQTLYFAPFSCSQLIHIALNKTGSPFNLEKIDIRKGEQFEAEYLAINPHARVPALVTDEGVITQAGSILIYLDEQYPSARLLPPLNDPRRYKALTALFFIATQVQPLFNMMFYPDRVSGGGIKDIADKTLSRIDDALSYFEQQLSEANYLSGDSYFACDYYLFVVLNWLKALNKNLDDYPKLQNFQAKMASLKEVRETIAHELPLLSKSA
jgi:glutathione S-transferase